MVISIQNKDYAPVNGQTYNMWLPRIIHSSIVLNTAISVRYGWAIFQISNINKKINHEGEISLLIFVYDLVLFSLS